MFGADDMRISDRDSFKHKQIGHFSAVIIVKATMLIINYCFDFLTASHFSLSIAVADSADNLWDSMINAMISTADLEMDP